MPLEQHPVPQEISSYEFRLVGDMTLKQFLQLAGGVGVAFLIFVTPLPAFIKWPVVAFAAISGAALAFLPIEERPLSFWFFSFIKAVYSPTLYSWEDGTSQDVFAKESAAVTPAIIAPQGQEKAEEYLRSVPQTEVVNRLEEIEKGFFKKIFGLFQTPTPSGTPTPTQVSPQVTSLPTPAIINPNAPLAPPTESIKIEHQQAEHNPTPITPVYGSNIQPARQAAQAQFALQAAPPNPPVQPNIIVGQVITNDGKIIESAILEIREVGGTPVRALRTNKIGHFMTVTPIKDGEYEILTEKEGLTFDVIKITASSNIIPPILIKAK
ncbi:MAG: PrgI family protein [Candidatus Blackburnbacteria bacterium]|nr:PrgI family protein [Candidatus Blackburnbacteria bacterium]